MTEKIDAERLAALLDGRLDERAREALLRELDAAGDDVRAAYADAVAVEGELAATADVRPFRRAAAPSRWRSGRTLLLAASLVGIVLLPWFVARSRTDVVEPARLVRQLALGDAATALPPAPWGPTRGGAAGMSPRGRAVRLGARLLDLELALAARDSGARAARSAASSVASLATMAPPLTGAPVELYREIAAGDSGALADGGARREGWDAMSELAGEADVRLGAWLEAARVAAARRDAGFFHTRATRRLLEGAGGVPDEEERAAMARVRSFVAGDVPDWGALEAALGEALRLAGR